MSTSPSSNEDSVPVDSNGSSQSYGGACRWSEDDGGSGRESPREELSHDWSDDDYFNSSPRRRRPRHANTKTLVDRISALPEPILLHILSFLPMHQVVATGVLSKRWQYLWTSTPNLVFRDPYRESNYKHEFARFVDRTLVLCGGTKINRFVVDFKYDSNYKSDVDLWVRFAVKNHAGELCLHLYTSSLGKYGLWNRYDLPHHLYANSMLTKLSLSQCLVAPNGVISWESLKSLTMGSVKLSDDVMQKILLGSPVLEYLELCNFYGINRLDITNAAVKKLVIRTYYYDGHYSSNEVDHSVLKVWAPNLLSLDILGCFGRNKCVLMNVESLVEANLSFNLVKSGDDYCEAYGKMLNELLGRLHHVEKLTMGTWCIQILFTLEKVGQLSPLSNRKYLTLDSRIKKQDLIGILNLLESSPDLQTLIVNMDPPSKSELYRSIDLISNPTEKRVFKCLSGHLKLVKIVNFVEGYSEFELLQFLLKNAKVLEKMIIHAPRIVPCDLIRATKRLLSYPRASPHAVILFSESC